MLKIYSKSLSLVLVKILAKLKITDKHINCTNLHLKTLKSHEKSLKVSTYIFATPQHGCRDITINYDVTVQVAYFLVHSFDILSCSSLLLTYCVAMEATSGSAGLQSASNDEMLSNTLDTVRAGDQLSFKMSKQIMP